MNGKFTMMSAMEAANIEDWVHEYLLDEGNNKEFSIGLKLEKRYFHKPVIIPLDFVKRTVGPEENMKYHSNEADFNKKVDQMVSWLMQGWDLPPLIVEYKDGSFILNDGNHRLEAMQRIGIEKYFAIFWCSADQTEKMYTRIRRFKQM